MRVSIITPSYNQGKYIEDTIQSVLSQDFPDVEHIIVDGGSRDNTLAILGHYQHLKWRSERDSGQANAINKGFRMASGDILAWLNSDDYYEPDILGEVVMYFESHPDCMVLYGDITYVDENKHALYRVEGKTIDYRGLLRYPDIVRQPSMFWRRCVVEECGGIDESFDLVMDYEFFLRVAPKFEFHYLNKNFSYYRTYPKTKTNSQLLRQLGELIRVFRKHGIALDFIRLRFLFMRVMDWLHVGWMIRRFLRPLWKKSHQGEQTNSIH